VRKFIHGAKKTKCHKLTRLRSLIETSESSTDA